MPRLELGDKVTVDGVKGFVDKIGPSDEPEAYRVRQKFPGSHHEVSNWYPADQVRAL